MTLKTKIYKHQQEAFNKLIGLKVGALYMEQGTGKTRVVLEMIKHRLDKGKINKVLWLCPCSVKEDLARNISYHADQWEDVIEIMGIQSLSSSISEINRGTDISGDRTFLVVDESNLVKNHEALRTERIQYFSELCKYKIILNGTPVSKNEADLYAQWKILDWRILGYKSFHTFAYKHIEWDAKIHNRIDKIIGKDILLAKIAPYTFQIKKDECLDLPKKINKSIYTFMTDEQESEYGRVANQLLVEIDEMKPSTIYRLFTGLQNVLSGKYVDCDYKITTSPMWDNPHDNPRIKSLLQLLDKIGDEKAIIYCKYTSEIKDIQSVLKNSVTFYGGDSLRQRNENLEQFKKNAQYLIANKACAGYGLNLQHCKNVVFYSNDWDYATRSQAEDRVHRIGQEHPVTIYDLYVPDTIDERIIKCLTHKENLVDYFKKNLKNIKQEFEKLNKKQAQISKEVLSENVECL